MYFVVFLFWLALAGLVGYVASERNRSAGTWALISLLFSPLIGLLALIAAGDATPDKSGKNRDSGGGQKAWDKPRSSGGSKKAWEKQDRSSGGSGGEKRKCLRKNKVRLPADYETCPACHNPVDDGRHPLVRK